jgi:hypothetical protein
LKLIGATRVEKFNFLVYTFQARRPKSRKKEYFIRFSPVISNRAATAVRTEVRSWNLPRRSDKAIEDLSRMFNPIIWGWLRYYGLYYPSALYPPMRQLDRDLALWAKRIQEAAWSSTQGDTQDRTDFSVRSGNVRTLADGRAAWLLDGNREPRGGTPQGYSPCDLLPRPSGRSAGSDARHQDDVEV